MSADQAMMGGVALLIGVLALTAAIHNRDWYFRLPKTRWIDDRWGRPVARAFYATVGVALLMLGIAIMLGIGRG